MAGQRVLIAGCGDLGTALGLRLAHAGHEVFGLRRRMEALPAPLRTVHADLNERISLKAVPRDIALVYYMATPAGFNDADYRATYVDGLGRLLEALKTKPQRLIFVSSTAVYGQINGEWVDEDSPAEPASFSGRRQIEGERLAHEAGCPSTIVRFGGIYGPGRTRMLRKLRAGDPCVADPPQYTNRIHRSDCIRVLEHLARPEIATGTYLAVDNEPCTQCELMDWLAAQMGLPQPLRVSGSPGGIRGSNKRARNDRLKASGYELLYPSFREGYGSLLSKEAKQAPR